MSTGPRTKLSIVVLNFRTPEMTVRAVRHAVDACDGVARELIVVDNGSGDGSAQHIAARCAEAHLIALPRNVGFAAGMNAGIREAAGSLVLLLNSDARPLPGSISHLVGYMAAHGDVGLAAPVIISACGERSRSLLIEPTMARALLPCVGRVAYRRWNGSIGNAPCDVEATEGCAVMVSRETLNAVGPMDERFFFYHEIVDWCMRIRQAGFRVVLVPAACVMHDCGGSSDKRTAAHGIELKRTEYQLIEKHLGRTLRDAAIARDVASSTIRSAFHGSCVLLSGGRWSRAREKLTVHFGALRWLMARMPGRDDRLYLHAFGGWE